MCGAVAAATLGVAPIADASAPDGPWGKGNVDKGELRVELYRGGAVPLELTVAATRDCDAHLELDMKWDAAENTVRIKLTGENALDRFPDLQRTEGVDFFPNAFIPEPEDIDDGRYQLWIVSAAGPLMPFYYDVETLDLVGGPPGDPPPMTIPVPFPTLYMFATQMFQPDHDGDVHMVYEFAYDSVRRGDRPELSYHVITFPPPNLCGANPFRLDLSTLRPYIADAYVTEEHSRPWSDFLRGGLLFDVTIEPAEYFTEPPRTTLIGTYSGATAVGGGVPRNWTLDIDAAFMNVAPPIVPWPGAGSCQNWFNPVHTQGLNFCAP